MHKCTKCGHEFDGKFCPECGERFVDKDVCPKCGAHYEEGAKFCPECGTRLDGKVACPQCGTLSDANAAFCGECGTKLDGSSPAKVKSGGAITAEKVKFYVYIAGIVCILLAALIGLAFTFATGVSLKTEGKIIDTELFYGYFGDSYKELDTVRDTMISNFGWNNIGGAREFALYFPTVLGTVISAVGILGVVALSVLTAYKVYQKFYNKKEVNVIAPAVATFLTYAAFATLILSLNMLEGSLKVTSSEAPISKTVFSTPTLAGLITGGVLLGLGLLLVAGSNYKAFRGFNASAGAVTSVAVCALTVVIIGLMELPKAGMRMVVPGYSYSTSMSLNPFMGMYAMLEAIEDDARMFEIIAYGTVGGCAAVALAVISFVTLFRKIPSICEGKNKGNYVLCAVAVALAIICLTFSILLMDTIITASLERYGATEEQIAETSKYYKRDYAAPIAMLVMAVLALATEVAGRVIIKVKGNATAQPVQSAQTAQEE